MKRLILVIMVIGMIAGCRKTTESKSSVAGYHGNPLAISDIGGGSECDCLAGTVGACYYMNTSRGDTEVCVTPVKKMTHQHDWHFGSTNPDQYSLVNAINSVIPSSYTALSVGVAQEFRDTFLDKTRKGRDYISYYYYISKVAFDSGALTLSNMLDHYNFAAATYAVANTLRNGSSSSVPVSNTYKSDALGMIAYYRTKCALPHFQTALDSMTADVTRCAGKTKAQIYSIYNWAP